jgi:hypothetical protein
MNDAGQKPRRRYLQFSLRTLLLLMLVLGGLLAWKIDKAKKQQASVAWVREIGGSVLYDHEVDDNGTVRSNARPQAPQWLIAQLGIDLFDQVVSVNLTNTEFRDLTPLQGLKSVQQLRLANTDVSDLSPLAELTGIRNLDLSGTEVSDLAPLAGMAKLRRLNVDHTPVSDLGPLAELTRLEGFYCQHTSVSDLSPLASCAGILSLNLTGSRVSDISALAGMNGLTKLDMRATKVADLSPLAGTTSLRHLDIFDTPVTDLSPLAETKGLGIELGGSALQQLLPLVGMANARIWLYKYPHQPVPEALKPRPHQVRIQPIYRRHDE